MPDEKTQVQKFLEATRQLVEDQEARARGGPKIVKPQPVKPE